MCHLRSANIPAIIPSPGPSSGPALSPGAARSFVTAVASAGGEGRERQDPGTQGPALRPIVRPLKTKHLPFFREAPRLLHKSGPPRHSDGPRSSEADPRAPPASPLRDRQVGGACEPHAWLGARPLPFLCGFSLFGAPWNRRCVCRPESGGLFPSPDHSGRPSPVVKHRREQGPIVRGPYHPDFTSARRPLFVLRQKKAFAQGRAGVPIASTHTEAKGEIDGRVHLGTGCASRRRGQWLHCPGAMFFLHYLSLSLFIQEERSRAGRKEQDTGVRGPLGPPRCSAAKPGVGRPEGGCCTAWGVEERREATQRSPV